MYSYPYPGPSGPLIGQAAYYNTNRKCPYCNNQLYWYTNYPGSAAAPRPDLGKFYCPACQRYY